MEELRGTIDDCGELLENCSRLRGTSYFQFLYSYVDKILIVLSLHLTHLLYLLGK